jgi:hypothetical protein
MAEASVAVLAVSAPRVRCAALMSSTAPLPFAGSPVSSTTSIVTGLSVSGSTGQALVLDGGGLLEVVGVPLEDDVEPDDELVTGPEDVPGATDVVGPALLLGAEEDDVAAEDDGEFDDDVVAGPVGGPSASVVAAAAAGGPVVAGVVVAGVVVAGVVVAGVVVAGVPAARVSTVNAGGGPGLTGGRSLGTGSGVAMTGGSWPAYSAASARTAAT